MPKNNTIAVEQLTEKTELRFTLDEIGGKELAQIRIWVKNSDGEMVPTRKGVAFPRTAINSVVSGVGKMASKIQTD